MASVGIPTTHALSLTLTGGSVLRDMFYNGNVKEEIGAVVARVSESFVRFGSFELVASRGGNAYDGEDVDGQKEEEEEEEEMMRMMKTRRSDNWLMDSLINYMIQYHYPHLLHLDEKNSSDENVKNNAIVVAMLGELARRTARIISQFLN